MNNINHNSNNKENLTLYLKKSEGVSGRQKRYPPHNSRNLDKRFS